MTYTIVGTSKEGFTSKKNGKFYLPIGVIRKDLYWKGIKPDQILLSEEQLEGATYEDPAKKIFEPDNGKTYYADIDYDNRGFIVGIRFYNKG